MNEPVTLQTLLIALAPAAALLLVTLFATAVGGSFEAAGRRLRGRPTRVAELERRIATMETAQKRARASELPLEIEAERLAEEIHQLESMQRNQPPVRTVIAEPQAIAMSNPGDWPSNGEDAEPDTAVGPNAAAGDAEAIAEVLVDLPPDPNESEEDRLAREQLEAEERERIEQLAAEEARIRGEREEAERRTRERLETEARRRRDEQEERDRIEREREEEAERVAQAQRAAEEAKQHEAERVAQAKRAAEDAKQREAERIEHERQEAEARKRHEEEQRRKAEEFRRRVADATPKVVMSAGGSNREAATINIALTNNLTPKHAELAVLSTKWAQTATAATFAIKRKDGLFEERWPKHSRDGEAPKWGTYRDATGRTFDCPEDAPTDNQVWIVLSYDRTVGGPAATWQRFEVGGAGALWYVRQPVGDPVIIEGSRDEGSEAAA